MWCGSLNVAVCHDVAKGEPTHVSNIASFELKFISALKAVRGDEIEEIRRAVNSPYQQDRDAYCGSRSGTGPEQPAGRLVWQRTRVRTAGDIADI